MSKSHVSMEQNLCLVTGKPFDTGAILLDKRLKNSLERNTVTNWGYSPEVEEKFKEGYIALVEVDESRCTKNKHGNVAPEDAYRLGRIAYIKKNVFEAMIENKIESKMIFVDSEYMDLIESIEVKD